MKNKVNLCFLADDNYVMQTVVTINSIFLNKNDDTLYDIYVILNNGSEENIKKIKEMENSSFKINIIKIDKMKELFKFDIEEISASPTAICKFYIPEILSDLDRVLYMDGDIIVTNDLLELYNIDIGDNYVGAVKDTCGLSRSLNKLFKKNVFYFNSGVMIMNLKKMRENNISDSLMDYRINGYNYMMDQDSLNYVLKDKVMELPFIYNTQLCCIDDVKRYDSNKQMSVLQEYFNLQYDVSKFEEIVNKAQILHYSGTLKPWNKANVAESDLWVYYYYKSPFKDIVLKKRIKNLKKRNIVSKFFKKMGRYKFMCNFIRNEE